MAEIIIYNKGNRDARTTKAFDVSITKELMRGYTLTASLANTDPARKCITNKSIIEARKQYFDITGYNMISGLDNTTQIDAEHVSYRLNNYVLPANYAFVGTIREIAQDILNTAVDAYGKSAAEEFSIGVCKDGTASLRLQNEQEITARNAFIAIQELGVESEYDNFTINLPERCGTGNKKTFSFDNDLVSVSRTWDRGNGTTYNIAIADLQRLPGHSGDMFDVGDDITVDDSFIGDTIERRVISYTYDIDNPQNDSITLGVFVRDSASSAVSNEVSIDNSVQQGQKYSNVYINHTDGFVAENKEGTQRAVMNGDDCFAVQIKKDEQWKTVSRMTDRGLAASCIENTERPGAGAIIGWNSSTENKTGLFLYDTYENNPNVYMQLWGATSGTKDGTINTPQGGLRLSVLDNKSDISIREKMIQFSVNQSLGMNIVDTGVNFYKPITRIPDTVTGTIRTSGVEITVKNGLITDFKNI